MIVTGSDSTLVEPSELRYASECARKRSSSRSVKSVLWCAPRDSSRHNADWIIDSETSSMEDNSRTEVSSVLNVRLLSCTATFRKRS